MAIHGEEVGHLLVERNSVSSPLRHFIGVTHVLVLNLHPFHLGLELYSVPVMSLCLNLLDSMLENVPAGLLFAQIVLGLPLAPDGNKTPCLLVAPIVRLGLGIVRGWDGVFHGSWWCLWVSASVGG